MKLELKCPKCHNLVGYSQSCPEFVYCNFCKEPLEHPLFKRIYSHGFSEGEKNIKNGIKDILGIENV